MQHALMHKRYALKVLNQQTAQQPEMVARFEREALAAAHVEHPNITAAIDFGKTDEGAWLLVLEYLGRPAAARRAGLKAAGCPTLHAHRPPIASAPGPPISRGIIHRDWKPGNIMLVLRQERSRLRESARFWAGQGRKKVEPGSDAPAQVLTKHGMVCGTPSSWPRAVRGAAVDGRADLYALGPILFEMLTGFIPSASDDISRIIRHQLTTPDPPLASVAKGFKSRLAGAIVMRLTQKQPSSAMKARLRSLAALAEGCPSARGSCPRAIGRELTPPPRPAVAEPARDGSALLLSAADGVGDAGFSKKALHPDALKPDTAATLHSIDIPS